VGLRPMSAPTKKTYDSEGAEKFWACAVHALSYPAGR
jgi:hypothetical protein